MHSTLQIAIFLRFRDDYHNIPETTIEAHNEIFFRKGKVWLGKFGLPINRSMLELCNTPNVETKLILSRSKTSKRDAGPLLFIADVSASQNTPPLFSLVPKYYRDQEDVYTWFCLSSEIKPLKTSEAKSWIVASSAQSLLVAVRRCPRTYFLLTKRADKTKVRSLLARAASTRATTNPAKRRRLLSAHKADYLAAPDFGEASADDIF